MSEQWWPDTDKWSEFVAPPFIAGGRGAAAQVPRILADRLGIGSGTVLVAADDIVLEKGLAAAMLTALDAAGFEVVISSGFGSEPSSEVIDAAAERAREAQVVAVIGIGGGSVLDSSKLIALLVRNAGSTTDWLGLVEPPAGVAPLLLIPTTCGTGSEATRIAMVTVASAKRASSCAGYVPGAVVLDPSLLESLPGHVVASTTMDALAHAVESLMSSAASPMTAHHALRAIELLVGNIEAASRGDGDALALCLWGSHLAGQALNAGVVVGHSLAYCLAWDHPMAHGTSCALVLPFCIAYNRHLEPALARSLARALTSGGADTLREAAGEILALAKRLGLPTTLDQAGVSAGSESALAARCVSEYPRPNNPIPLDEQLLTHVLKAMRSGDLDAAFRIPAPLGESN